MSESIDRTDCPRCGGDGQVMEDYCGRSGYAPCPDCENVPRFAVPDDPPENPQERLAEIDEELEALVDEKEEWQQIQRQLKSTRETLKAVASHNLVPDDDQAVLSHIADQIGMHRFDRYEHGLYSKREQLRRERAELETLVNHLEGEQ